MSDNSSFPFGASLHPFSFHNCFHCTVSNFIVTAITVTNSLLTLPVSVIVLHVGRRRRQHPTVTSHTEVITYHMVLTEIMYIVASVLYCISVYTDLQWMMMASSNVSFIVACGQMFFHVLTCVERYLAVVHPVTYLHLRKGGRVTVRNTIVWCVWLLGLAKMGVLAINSLEINVLVYLIQQAVALAAVAFCSIAVLQVLKRPGPGEGGGDRERVDQSKRRAFNTIVAIMWTLVVRFGGCLVCTLLYSSSRLSINSRCVAFVSSYWFCLPSSLVSPLLFLHRAGKLPCFKGNTESERQSP
ncbi:hypothetical protein L3Q82_003893 [Scortum barcoo]|uniref:Uncharacterized protein n=1 Tax=Scortum barcoo TaxID=214431 RepID=A0ACB8X688_9TELE|nr:hypothetical protein L3Q82_003893 [Scortum barcoo]